MTGQHEVIKRRQGRYA